MNILDATIFGYTAWRICLGTALLLLYVALRIYWARAEVRRLAENDGSQDGNQNSNASAGSAVKTASADKSPVGLSDTQRIDQLHRLVSLKAGEQADLKDLTFGRLPRFRVAFAGIEHESGQDFAHIKLELGGATAACGPSVQELGENDFLVPRAASGGQNCAIHYTCDKSDGVSFLQVVVSKFDAIDQSAAIDVMHVRGRRAA